MMRFFFFFFFTIIFPLHVLIAMIFPLHVFIVGKTRCLVATDVAARGLDVKDVRFVASHYIICGMSIANFR